MRWAWLALLAAACARTEESPPVEAVEAVDAVALTPPPAAPDPTAGFVQVRGPIEEAVVEVVVEESPAPARDEASWHSAVPWVLLRGACYRVDDGPRAALLTDPRRDDLLEGLADCRSPAWCRVGLAALEGADDPTARRLLIGLSSCPSPALDTAIVRLGAPDDLVDARLDRMPGARVPARAELLEGLVLRRLGADPEGLPTLVRELRRGGQREALDDALVSAWREVGDPLHRARIGKVLAWSDDATARAIHRSTCEDWAYRYDPLCVDVRDTPLALSVLAELVRERAAQASLDLHLARFERDWPRRAEDLAVALEACVVARPDDDLWTRTESERAAAACLDALVARDLQRARSAAAGLRDPGHVLLRRRAAALAHADDQALVDSLVAAGLLPEGTAASELPPASLATDWLLAHGRAVDAGTLFRRDATDYARPLRVLLAFAGARVDHAATGPHDTTAAPPRILVQAWAAGERIAASILPPDEGDYAPHPDRGDRGLVAFVNAVLARAGTPERLFLDGQTGLVLRATPAAIAALVEGGHIAPPELTAAEAVGSAVPRIDEPDTGGW